MIGPENGLYSVQVDDQEPTLYNVTSRIRVADSLLYHGDSFEPGVRHTVSLACQSQGSKLEIDYATRSISERFIAEKSANEGNTR